MSLAWAPRDDTLTSSVAPVRRSCRKTSCAPLVSPRTRLEAGESKAMNRPSADIVVSPLLPSAWAPLEETLTRVVTPATRSRTKASEPHQGQSGVPLVSPGTRLLASEVKAT